jgi:hypothetical protein
MATPLRLPGAGIYGHSGSLATLGLCRGALIGGIQHFRRDRRLLDRWGDRVRNLSLCDSADAQAVTLSAVIIPGHMSLKIFDLIVALGRKDQRLDVPVFYMWTTTFEGTNYAHGAAIGFLMLISVAILVVPYLITSMRSEAEV